MLLAGVDEAGRGAWAGPVVAGAVILPTNARDEFLKDSKKLTPKKREEMFLWVTEKAVAWGVGEGSVSEIDSLGIAVANRLAMQRAVINLKKRPDEVWIDGLRIRDLDLGLIGTVKFVVRGDDKIPEISAASIVAKVYRDNLMKELEEEYVGYGLAGHKGYGAAKHRQALEKLGVSKIHRRSFRPMKEMLTVELQSASL